MFKHHFVKRVNWEVTVGVSIFECGHRGVKRVCLMAERGVVHGDDFESMLEGKTEQNKPLIQTTGTFIYLSCGALMPKQYMMRQRMFTDEQHIPRLYRQESALRFQRFVCSSSSRCS